MKPAYLYAKITDDDFISLKWKWYGNKYDVAGFKIERRSVDTIDFTTIGTTEELFFVDKDLPEETDSYIYRVYAFKGNIVSGYSNETRIDIGKKEISEIPVMVHEDTEPQVKPTISPVKTAAKIVQPKPTTTPIKVTEPGTVWLVPDFLEVQTGTHFTTSIHINTGKNKLAAYGMTIKYSDALLDVDRDIGNNGVIAGSDGFVSAVNARDPGVLFFSGVDPYGKGPGEDFHLVTIQWKALSNGVTKLELIIDKIANEKAVVMKNLKMIDGLVKIMNRGVSADTEIAYNDQNQETETVNKHDSEGQKDHSQNNENDGLYNPEYDDYEDPYISMNQDPGWGSTEAPMKTAYQTGKPTNTDAPTVAPKVTSVPTARPVRTARPTAPPKPLGPGGVWIEPPSQTVEAGDPFTTEIHVNTGNQKIAAYGIYCRFERSHIIVDVSRGNHGVEAGPDGFIAAVNPNVNGRITISGFDISGKGPGTDLFILEIFWKSVASGIATIEVYVDTLADDNTRTIGNPRTRDGQVILTPP